MMAARLKRHIHSGTTNIYTTRSRITQGRDFGVCLTRRLRMTLSYHDTLFNDHATNPRIRAGDEKA
jgi:hypothetical protein